jgi:hypothetical protein
MRPAKRLKVLQNSTLKRLAKLRVITYNLGQRTPSRETKFGFSYVVIDLLNTWSNFSRAYYLSCILRPQLEGGGHIAIIISGLNFNDALGLAIRAYSRSAQPKADGTWHRKDEPAWHDPNVLMKLSSNLGCSNLANIQSAFSSGSRVFLDLPVFRNYFAHKNQQSEYAAMQRAIKYGIPSNIRPLEILLARPLNRHQALIFDWLDDIAFVVEYLCL